MQNPYDRRVDPRRRGMTPGDGQDYMPVQAAQDAQTRMQMERAGLTIDDVHAIAGQAYMRGREDAEAALVAEQRDEIGRARRLAWDEGKDAGVEYARGELIQRYDDEVIRRLRHLHGDALTRIEADPKTKSGREATTKAELLEFARRVAVATDKAIVMQAEIEERHRSALPF